MSVKKTTPAAVRGVPKAVEAELRQVAESLAEVVSTEELFEMFLPSLLEDEALVRQRRGPNSPTVRMLDAYHEQVRQGVRPPVSPQSARLF